MQAFPDIATLFRDFGIIVAIGAVLAYLFARYFAYQSQQWFVRCRSIFRKIDTIETSLLDPHNGQVRTNAEILDRIEDLGAKIDQKCGSAACPVVAVVNGKLDKLERQITSLSDDTTTTRRETTDLVRQVFERIHSFTNETMREVINVLRTGPRTRG